MIIVRVGDVMTQQRDLLSEKQGKLMRNILKNTVKYISVYIVTAAVLLGLLVAAALIPQSSIRKNMGRSAEFLCENELFVKGAGELDGGKLDRYADAVLLGIAYQYDSDKPLESVMWSAYYNDKTMNANENLRDAVSEGKEANQQYLRYWHGSNVIVRPLHTVLSLKGIYILNAVLLGALAGVLFYLLKKEKAYILIAGLAVSFALTMVWMVPFSLEYTWNFYIMLVMSIIMVLRERKGRKLPLGIPFMLCGMITCFLDFLTTELLTLFVPLLIVMWFRWRNPETIGWKKLVPPVVSWGAGYVCMWFTKWITASIVLGESVIPYVKENLEERISGYVGLEKWDFLKGALTKNITALLPWNFGGFGVFIGFVMILAVLYLCYVYKKKTVRKTVIFIYAAIAVIPFVRYLVLHNHAYLHYFFTFRTLIVTVLAVTLIMGEMIDWRLLKHENKKKRRA